MRPDEALQRLQLFETKYSRLKEERDKVGKAKEALELQETGPISTNEERMQVNSFRKLQWICLMIKFLWEIGGI